MLHSEKIGNELYQNLGKLFYAVAMADKNVRPKEIEKLKEDVRRYWLPVDDVKDEFGTDAAYQIEIVFDWLQNEEKESDLYFEEFKTFYHDFPNKFTPEIKSLILQTANDIAASFSGKNKSELILITRLELLMK